MKKRGLLLLFILLSISLFSYANSGIYLYGDKINNWAASSDWEFIDEGNGVYALYDKEISGLIKVADISWGDCNYGAFYSNNSPSLGIARELCYNGYNINLGIKYQCSKITFTVIPDENPTLLIEGTPIENSGIYLRGETNNWNAQTDWEFIEEGNGVYKLTNKELGGRFKIGDLNWGECNYGHIGGESAPIELGVVNALSYNKGDIFLDKTYQCSTITLTLLPDNNATILIEGVVKYNSAICIIGAVNGWKFDPTWEFIDEGEGVFTLSDKKLYGEFTIHGLSVNKFTYSAITNTLTLNTAFPLSKDVFNPIVCNDSFDCTKITLTFSDDGTVSLFVEGEVIEMEAPAQVYVIGNNNNWDFNDESGKLLPTENPNEYNGIITFKNSGDGFCYWRIYEGLGAFGSWGNPGGFNTTVHTTLGTLESNSNGCITTNPGKYNVTFDYSTGEFSAVPEESTGVSSSSQANTEFVFDINDGILYLHNNEIADIYIYTQTGTLLYAKKAVSTIDLSILSTGIYIVNFKNSNKEETFKIKL